MTVNSTIRLNYMSSWNFTKPYEYTHTHTHIYGIIQSVYNIVDEFSRRVPVMSLWNGIAAEVHKIDFTPVDL